MTFDDGMARSQFIGHWPTGSCSPCIAGHKRREGVDAPYMFEESVKVATCDRCFDLALSNAFQRIVGVEDQQSMRRADGRGRRSSITLTHGQKLWRDCGKFTTPSAVNRVLTVPLPGNRFCSCWRYPTMAARDRLVAIAGGIDIPFNVIFRVARSGRYIGLPRTCSMTPRW